MREMLEQKLTRFEELEEQLADPSVQSNSQLMASFAREHGSLAKLATKYRRFKSVLNEINDVREMAKSIDSEEQEMAAEELTRLLAEREKLWDELLDLTVGGEDANRTRCVMEIRAGTGGEEAALFAQDLFQMYKHHAEAKRWKMEIMEASSTDMGGFSKVTLAFEGEGVYRELRYEGGTHRVHVRIVR